jgi:hypothetical protein
VTEVAWPRKVARVRSNHPRGHTIVLTTSWCLFGDDASVRSRCRLVVPGLNFRLTGLLSREFVDRSASQACSARTWSFYLADLLNENLVGRSDLQLSQQGLGQSLCLTGLVGEDLVVSPRRLCSVRTWLVAPPRRLARRGLGRSLRLAGLLGEDLIVPPRRLTL